MSRSGEDWEAERKKAVAAKAKLHDLYDAVDAVVGYGDGTEELLRKIFVELEGVGKSIDLLIGLNTITWVEEDR